MHPKPLTCGNTPKPPLNCRSRYSTVRAGSRCFATSRGLTAACQNGLVEDHSDGYRIEPFRPGRVLVGFRPDQSRRGEVLLAKVRPLETCPSQIDLLQQSLISLLQTFFIEKFWLDRKSVV